MLCLAVWYVLFLFNYFCTYGSVFYSLLFNICFRRSVFLVCAVCLTLFVCFVLYVFLVFFAVFLFLYVQWQYFLLSIFCSSLSNIDFKMYICTLPNYTFGGVMTNIFRIQNTALISTQFLLSNPLFNLLNTWIVILVATS